VPLAFLLFIDAIWHNGCPFYHAPRTFRHHLAGLYRHDKERSEIAKERYLASGQNRIDTHPASPKVSQIHNFSLFSDNASYQILDAITNAASQAMAKMIAVARSNKNSYESLMMKATNTTKYIANTINASTVLLIAPSSSLQYMLTEA